MGTEFEDKIVLEGCRKGYCEYGPAAGILCQVHDVLGNLYLTRLSSLIQFVPFKPLSYCFKETIGFDVKASFASRP